MEKSKEVIWRALSQAEKEEFDEAQAVEVTNVVRERGVRALTAQEMTNVDSSKVTSMRWALTRKSFGTAKARLVVLRFQARNLTCWKWRQLPCALSRTGRHVLLTVASNAKMVVESGDVTSAFLQTIGSLESQNLIVFALAELAAMFGADRADAGVLMKLTKALYSLVHAPRKCHESVVSALLADGWAQLKCDCCLFALRDGQGRLFAFGWTSRQRLSSGGPSGPPVVPAGQGKSSASLTVSKVGYHRMPDPGG